MTTYAESGIRAAQESFFMGIHEYNYKNGHFKDRITKETSCRDTINTLLASPLVTQPEKEKLRLARASLLEMEKALTIPISQFELLVKSMPLMNVFDIFTEDAKR
ncbi:hypothetical protein AJ79_00206 [Helicocarpus griseus UAMH5409]|uniref:Uncharacterized protein n=1 Tax=Helicocarpus griseus UAMH5409 TaxID=1447875 RepID=A0A2B7YCN1_9EURO|nr:hypothetical protein AJ79_00206 [Helicocarpus griseus UAMH5409]